MPRWLLMLLVILGWTLVVPVFVLGNTGSWRRAWMAWWFFGRYLMVLMVPAIVVFIAGWLV